uniref:Uncharacterized protein n=1 Tax=Cannabis sativa TaxID=3483 RepID=A0A803PD50_CANSA
MGFMEDGPGSNLGPHVNKKGECILTAPNMHGRTEDKTIVSKPISQLDTDDPFGCEWSRGGPRKGVCGIENDDEGEGDSKKQKGGSGQIIEDRAREGKDGEIGHGDKGKNIVDTIPFSYSIGNLGVERVGFKGRENDKVRSNHGQRKKLSIKNRAHQVHGQTSVEKAPQPGTNVEMTLNLKRRALLCKTAKHNDNAKLECPRNREPLNITVGLSGGLLLMWKEELKVRVSSSSSGHIVAEVAGYDFLPWTLTCFYRHPDATQRKFSWQLLRNIKGEVHGSWLCIGDFNEIVSLAEKTGARTRGTGAMEDFKEVIDAYCLIDFSSVRLDFTWCNEHGSNQIMESLDRGLCNEKWMRCFEGAYIRVLDWWESDHRPLLVDMPMDANWEHCE